MNRRILIFSLGPVFRDHVHGGSQKILREVALWLGKTGNTVDIFCVHRSDNYKRFNLSDNVTVFPELKFKPTFPASYHTAPYNLSNIIRTLYTQINMHDILYIHDAGLNFPFLCTQSIPTVISVRDYHYPETLLGVFNFTRDIIIVNSRIVRDSILNTVGTYLPEVRKRIVVIPNGINLDFFRRKSTRKIIRFLNIPNISSQRTILYPHRPDPTKGIFHALDLIVKLKHRHGMKDVKLLIPNYLDRDVTTELDTLYEEIARYKSNHDINENILIHDWIPYHLLPEYYSLGCLTLCIGNFIEAFGSNSSLESLACGTPVILTRVGAQRTTLPEGITPKVNYGDWDEVETIALKILTGTYSKFDTAALRTLISRQFSYEFMLRQYADVINNATILPSLEIHQYPQWDSKTSKFKLAPWCHTTESGIYNDYAYGYVEYSQQVLEFLYNYRSFSVSEARKISLSHEDLMDMVEKGILVIENKDERSRE